MIRVAIAGASGYTGFELIRILVQHPEVRLTAITSRAQLGQRLDDFYPGFRGHCELVFEEPDRAAMNASAREKPTR